MSRRERLSTEGRAWERSWNLRMGLEDVPWNPRCCCSLCCRPGREEDAPVEEMQEEAPRSGVVLRRPVQVVEPMWAWAEA